MKKTIITLGTVFIILLIALIYFINLFVVSKFQPINMIQYAGEVIPNEAIDRPEISLSTTAEIQNYKIVTSKSNYMVVDIYKNIFPAYGCLENACNGVNTAIDDNGCQLYGKSITISRWSDESFDNGKWKCDENFCNNCYYNSLSDCPSSIPDNCCWDEPSTIQCGGYNIINKENTCCDTQRCWAKFDIYENNMLINSSPWTYKQIKFDLNGLTMMANINNVFQQSNCYRIENTFTLSIPDDSFNFDVSVPKLKYFVGEDAKVDIKIINNWKDVKAYLIVDYEVPTAVGTAKKIIKTLVDLPKGESLHSYIIPTEMIANEMQIIPSLDIIISGSEFKGVNGICYGSESNLVTDLNKCNYVSLGNLIGNKSIVTISSEVSCKENDCPIGTKCDEESGLCIKKIVERPLLVWIIVGMFIILAFVIIFIFWKKK